MVSGLLDITSAHPNHIAKYIHDTCVYRCILCRLLCKMAVESITTPNDIFSSNIIKSKDVESG